MAEYNFFNSGTNSQYNNAVGGGGYGSAGGGSSTPVSNTPTARILSFTITSSPNGASILIDGNNTGFTTPHVLTYLETELLTPKTIAVVNGTNSSIETYIISSEVVTSTTDGTTTNGGSYGGGYSSRGGGAADPYSPSNAGDPNNNANYLGDRQNFNQR